MRKEDFIVGERYYAKNKKAGRNIQSLGEIVEWKSDNDIVMHNKKWGYFHTTLESLIAHN